VQPSRESGVEFPWRAMLSTTIEKLGELRFSLV